MLKQSQNESWRITHLAIGSHIWSLFASIHMNSLAKVKLGLVIIWSIFLSTLIGPQNTILVNI